MKAIRLLFCAAALCCFLLPGSVSAADKPNLNSATLQELSASPAVGPELAARIIELRESAGDFLKWDDLKEINGIDDAKIKAMSAEFQIKEVVISGCRY